MRFLALTLYFLARIISTLISSPAIIGCFQKVNFHAFLSASCELFEKQAVLCGNIAFQRKEGKLALCNKPLYKSDKQFNFAFNLPLL